MVKKMTVVVVVAILLLVIIAMQLFRSSGGGPTVLRLMSTETDAESIRITDAIIADFESRHPGVSVEVSYLGWEAMFPQILAGIQAGSPPDVVGITNEEAVAFAEHGDLLPVTSLVANIGGDFFDGSRVVLNGEDYYVPYASSFLMLFYRPDLLEQAQLEIPKTWAEWLVVAERLTTTNPDGTVRYGTALPLGNGQATVNFFCTLLFSNGGRLFDENDELVFDRGEDRERTLETIRFIDQLAAFSPPDSIGYEWKDLTAQYYTGSVASTYYAGRVVTLTEQYAPGMPISATPYPYGREPSSATFSDGWAILRGTSNAELAGELVRALVSGDRYVEFLHTVPLHMTPPRLSVLQSDGYRENDVIERYPEIVAATRAVAGHARTIPSGSGKLVPRAAELVKSQLIEPMLQRVVTGEATPEQALDDAAAAIRSELDG